MLPPTSTLRPWPVRLRPGDDLRGTLEAVLAQQGVRAGVVIAGMGSLSRAQLRLGGASDATRLTGDLELLGLAGSISPDGAHLHGTLATARGEVIGGQLVVGCTVRTTAEILLALLPGWDFRREHDPATGYPELVVRLAI